jgi:hypothetical protein
MRSEKVREKKIKNYMDDEVSGRESLSSCNLGHR